MATAQAKEFGRQRNIFHDLHSYSKKSYRPKLDHVITQYEEVIKDKADDQLIPEMRVFRDTMKEITEKQQKDKKLFAKFVFNATQKARTESRYKNILG